MEDAEKYQAIQTLTELGLLIPVTEVDTYHGRIGSKVAPKPWSVDPSFRNGTTDNNSYNLNGRSTLYTGEEVVAGDFAIKRVWDIAGPKYDKFFSDRIRSYSPEEKQEWFEREKRRLQRRWDTTKPEGRGFMQNPATFTPQDLHEWKEIRRLEAALAPDQRDALRGRAVGDLRAEVHQIVTDDTDATVIDLGFNASQLSSQDEARYKKALITLMTKVPLTDGSPVDFQNRSAVRPIIDAIQARNKNQLFNTEIEAIAQETGINSQVVTQIVSAFNTASGLRSSPIRSMMRLLGSSSSRDIVVEGLNVDGKAEEISFNMEYLQRYLRSSHIVGVKQNISSATLNRSTTSISFFDLEKVGTEEDLAVQRSITAKKLGGMATTLSGAIETSARFDKEPPLIKLLTNAYTKPQVLIEAARQVEGYGRIFDTDAGNWEGYTLAEHTETVLGNFDENYADTVPVEFIPIMRLAIITHDLGKPAAVADRSKHLEKQYNARQATDFLAKIGISEPVKKLVLAMIGDGSQLAFQMNVNGNRESAAPEMGALARVTLSALHEGKPVSNSEMVAFYEMCSMLQVCDGGAYTSMAVTRSRDTEGKPVRYRNAPSFNASFSQPHGFGRRTIKLRGKGETPAAHDLTPKSQ